MFFTDFLRVVILQEVQVGWKHFQQSPTSLLRRTGSYMVFWFIIICLEGTQGRDHRPTKGQSHGSALSFSQNL